MTYLIFGGAGFIGINFVKKILKSNEKIIIFDKLTKVSNAKEVSAMSDNNELIFIQDDICNTAEVYKCLKQFQPDYIINFAAETHVDTSIEKSFEFIKTNILGTHSILESLKKYGYKKNGSNMYFKFLNISTDEVYGSLEENEESFVEDSKYYPNSPYSASKAGADHLVRSFYKTFGLPVITTNCSNNYGPFQHFEKLIPLTIKKCINLEEIPIYGDGKNIRDWIFVDDHCRALKLVLDKGVLGTSYNIGGNFEIRNIDLVNSICSYFDKTKPQKNMKYSDLITFVEDRLGHDKRYSVNNKKVFRELNWSPLVCFEDGLRITIDWYIDNIET